MNIDYWVILPFVLYFALVIGIGIWSARFSSQGMSEYFLGGRQMNRFVVALSAVVSGRSAWLMLGFTGLAYMVGFSAIWSAIGYITVEFLLFFFYAPRIRSFTEEHECITVPDYYAARFGDNRGVMRTILVLIFIVFMVTYVSAQFVAGGKAFYAHFGIPVHWGIVITAGIVLLYTILGGFLAVSLTDVLQAFFMIFMLVILPVIGIIAFGGWNHMTDVLSGLPQINKHGTDLFEGGGNLMNPFSYALLGAVGALGIGLGSPGSPHIIVRYMSIRDQTQFRWTAYVGTGWNIVMAAGALLIGLIGRAWFNDLAMLPDADPENLFVHLANHLLHPFWVGLMLASIFAAIMSTADSQLLVAASSVVRDFYEKVLGREGTLSQRTLATISRAVVTVLVVLAVILGFYVTDLVFWFVLFAWAGLGAAVGSTSVLALFWKRTSYTGAIAGLITGAGVTFLWKLTPALSALIYELVPAFILAVIATVIFSLIFPKRKESGKKVRSDTTEQE